ncbi:hypothetical protein ACQ4M3_20335 [Leptolyngbya sp. AN03gr2]
MRQDVFLRLHAARFCGSNGLERSMILSIEKANFDTALTLLADPKNRR